MSVIESCAPRFPEPTAGTDVADGLRELMHHIADAMSDPEWARVIPALLMLKHHEAGIAAMNQRLEHEQDQVLTGLLQRGVAEGLLAADLDPQEALTSLLGPLLFAQLTDSVKIDAAFVDRTVDRFLAAYRAYAAGGPNWVRSCQALWAQIVPRCGRSYRS